MLNGLAYQQPEGVHFPELGDRFEEWWSTGLEWWRDLTGQVGGPEPKEIPEVGGAPAPAPPPPTTAATISKLTPLIVVIIGIIAIVWIRGSK
jgi:hypothetical protein